MSKKPVNQKTAVSNDDELLMLDELTAGEDEFDVDLMACGCRVAPTTKLNLGIEDVIKLFNMTDEQRISLIGALVDETGVSPDRFLEMADMISRGDLVEASLDEADRVSVSPRDDKTE